MSMGLADSQELSSNLIVIDIYGNDIHDIMINNKTMRYMYEIGENACNNYVFIRKREG